MTTERTAEVTSAGELAGLYVEAMAVPAGGRLVVQLPAGPLAGGGAATEVRLGAVTGGGTPDLEVLVTGPSPEQPAVLDAVSLAFSGRAFELRNVVLRGSRRAALSAVVSERLVLRSAVVTGSRIGDATQVAVLDVSVAPDAQAEVLLEDSWVVDTGGVVPLMGMVVRTGSRGSTSVVLRRSGFAANRVVHELVVDGTRSVRWERSLLVRPADERADAGGLLLSPGTSLTVVDSLVAAGAGRLVVDPGSGSVPVEVSGSTAVTDPTTAAACTELGFATADDAAVSAVRAAGALTAEDAVSAVALARYLPGSA